MRENSLVISRVSLIIAQLLCVGFLNKNIQILINQPSIIAKWFTGISFVLFLLLLILSLMATLKLGKMKAFRNEGM